MISDNHEEEWFSLLEASNPIYDDKELDALYANSNEAVSESVNLSSVKVGEVYHAGLPFFNFADDEKYRWGIIIDLGNGDLRFLMCSSVEEDKESKKRAQEIEYNHTIENWRRYGFTRKSFSCGSVFFPLTEIKLRKKMGVMSKEEYDQCMEGVRLFLREKFKSPWTFMNWMKNEVIRSTVGPNGNNNLNPIQSLEDIEKSKRANCVDIALAVYEICKRSRNSDKKYFGEIAWMSFLYKNGNSSFGHLFAFWKYYNRYYALRFITEEDKHPTGEIISYFNAKPGEIVRKEMEFFRPRVEEIVGEKTEPTYWIFDQDDKAEMEASISDKRLQHDLLEYVHESHEFVRMNENDPMKFLPTSPKGTTESVTSQILPGDVVPGYPTRIFVKDLEDGSYCFDDTETNMRMRTLNYKENGYTIDNLEANFAKYVPESVEVIDENEPAMEAAKYIDKKLTYSEVKDGIQYIFSDDGIANSYYEIDGEKYRVRVETIVKREVNGTYCVFFEKKDKETHYGTMYKLPGGSVEIDKSLAEQAECEVNEEILCKVKNVHYTGKYYIVKYDKDSIPEWHKRILWPIGLKYVGAISFVFTAEYDGPYKKKVDEKDKDSLAQKGDWYPIWEFEEIKSDVHQGIALESMEVVEEAFTTKDNIIPVDYSGYDGIDTRIMCLNTHCLNGIEFMVPWVAGFTLLGEPLLGTLIEFTAYTAYALADQIFAVDIFAVDKDINIRNDCEGLPIIACNDGTVVESVNDVGNELGEFDKMLRKYGNYVVISHDNGRWFSVYAHLVKGSVTVKAGNKVHRGQKIAELGHSGNSDAKASHLHFEMLWTNVMAKNRPSLLLDLPKTLSGFGEYECTKIPWSTASKIWIPFNKLEGLKQAYKEPMEPNTSGELSGACFLTETPDKTVEEVYLPIMESAKQFKSSKAKNFEDFCKECKTPEDAMNWFIANKVIWNDKANDDKMRWPDTLVKERKGNCLDQSVMMHFFFKKRHIEHRMALFTIRLENGSTAGHIFPLFKRGKYVYAWLYIGPGHGVITGPYKSWYDAAGQVTEFYKVLILSSPKKQFDSPVSDTTEWSVQEYSETEHLDKYLNKDIVQKDYLYADGGDNLWSTHFFSRDFRFIRIPKVSGVLYKLLAWSKQYQTPKDKQVAKEALALIEVDRNKLEVVQEDHKLSVYTKQYKTLDDFCKTFKTFEDLVTWFQANHIKWPDYKERNENGPVHWTGEVHWPEDILQDKVGNCFDQALFAYYFCKRNNIPARVYRFARFYNTENSSTATMQCVSHFVTMVRRQSGIYIFSYGGIFNDTAGPFLTYEKAAEKYTKRLRDFFYMVMMANQRFYGMNLVSRKDDERRLIVRNGYFTDADLEFIDKLYGDKRLTQNEIIKKSEGCMFAEDGKVLTYTPFDRFVNTIRKKAGEIGFNLSQFIASKESVEQPEVIKQDHTEVDMGICNHVLKYLGNSIDVQKFADIKSGRRFMYTRCKIMKKDIPLVLLLAYCEGLTTVLRKAEVNFSFSDTRPRLKEMEAVRKGVIPFADGYLVYDKFPLEVSLLMNGFGMVDTRGFDYAEMDGKDVYVSLFDILFGTRMLANALDNFYDWMIDPVTFQVLEDLNYPTDFVGLLLAGNKLLADNSFTNELDMRNYRIRSNEMAYAYAFKAISEAYGKFRMTAGNKNPSKISIPQGVVIKDIMQSQVVEDVSELSPIVEVEKAHLVTDKGPSGTNLKEAYTMKRRCYDKSMVGVMAIAQSPDANVGITKTLTLNPNVTNGRGYVKPLEERDLDDSNIFSMAELATPLAMNHDRMIVDYMSNHIMPMI